MLASGDFQSLSEMERKKMDARLLIVKTKKIPKKPWPEVMVYATIKATARESAAIFTAYQEHKDYIPDLLKSDPVKYVSKRDVHVAFILDVPWPLANSHFITGNRLSRTPEGGYRIEWYFVKSDSSRNNYGEITFIPGEDGKQTDVFYRNFSHPKSSLAKLFKGKMVRKVRKTVVSIRNYIEEKRKNKSELSNYIRVLEEKFED